MSLEKFNCSYSELLELSKVVPNPKNNNRHSIEQIKRLAKIIDFQGQRSPIVISKRTGFIVKGHCRLEAIKHLGWEHVAVDYQDYISEAQEYADMTADNEIARWAELDRFQLFEDLKSLEANDISLGDMELLGIEGDIFKNLAESEDIDLSNADDIESNYSFAVKCSSKVEFDRIKKFFGTESKAISFSEIEHLVMK